MTARVLCVLIWVHASGQVSVHLSWHVPLLTIKYHIRSWWLGMSSVVILSRDVSSIPKYQARACTMGSTMASMWISSRMFPLDIGHYLCPASSEPYLRKFPRYPFCIIMVSDLCNQNESEISFTLQDICRGCLLPCPERWVSFQIHVWVNRDKFLIFFQLWRLCLASSSVDGPRPFPSRPPSRCL